jgi:hypothetical protein
MMKFIYLTDMMGTVWLVNRDDITKAVDITGGSMIYFNNGAVKKLRHSLLELASMLNA